MSLNDLSLNCSECKKHFTSAALLLQHYAQHIIFSYSDAAKSLRAERKRKRKEKQAEDEKLETGQNVSSPTSCSNSSTSAKSISPTHGVEAKYLPQEQNNNELNDNYSTSLPTPEPLNLVKFDLQQCLENKVTKEENDSDMEQGFPVKIESVLDIKEEYCDQPDDDGSSSGRNDSGDRNESEDFNPLKFCMITMEEDNSAIKTSEESSHILVMPELQLNDVTVYRKLAPKPVEKSKFVTEKRGKSTRKYPCHLCEKVFGWSTDLKRHVLIHTGERPFKCKVCLASFTRNFLLQKHQSKIHPCSKPIVKDINDINEKDSPPPFRVVDLPQVLKI
ncbi:unnamed protein product [Bemisia tabaci]|uniref:C2H2-type domain-containing protein n=1 Tax=Bemisia tabaci TaxID=7038 RepID=A0A9P0AH58_BEMTA|nr:unnamed protein product [Bemisia tabaci]